MTSMGTSGLEKVIVKGVLAVGSGFPDDSMLPNIEIRSALTYATKDTNNTAEASVSC